MSVYEKIIRLLESNQIKYQTLKHGPTPTCADAARVRGTSPDQGAKALVCFADKQPVLIVLPCSRKLDVKQFKFKFKFKDLRFATPSEVEGLTGLEVGAIPPLGSVLGLPTYLDVALGQNQTIAFNAGERTRSIIMVYCDFTAVQPAQISSFSTVAS